MIVNHLLFADDAVIFAPSAKGLQQLLDICSKFALTHNVVFSRIVNIWNNLPDSVVTAPLVATFRDRLRNCDLSKYVLY